MLKTYITTIDGVKKFEVAQILRYLISPNHKNHIGRTEIFSNSQDHWAWFRLNAAKIRANIRYKQEMKRNGKAGWHNVSTEGNKALVFNVPVSYNPTKDQMVEIQNHLMHVLVKRYRDAGHNVSEKDFFSNCHIQQNNHINFLTPGFDLETNKVIKLMKMKGFRPLLAEDFTKILDKVMNTNFEDYNKGNETLAMCEREEKKLLNNEYSLKELEELAAKPYKNKMLKNLYKMFVRAKKEVQKQKDNTKTLKRVNKTIKKLEEGNAATKEEKQQLRDVLASINGKNVLTEQARKELKKGTKMPNTKQMEPK